MARMTARKLAGSTVAAARRVTRTGSAAKTAGSATKAAPAKKTATKKAAPAAKAPAKKAPAKKAPAKKAAAKKVTPLKKAAAKRAAPVKKAPAKKAAVKKTAQKTAQAPVKKTAAKKSTAKKASVTNVAPVQKAPAKKAPAKKAPAKKAPATKAATSAASTPRKLAVKADEKPWTKSELNEVRGELNTDRERLRSELNLAEHELHDLMRDAGDGAGNDQADVGSTTFERDHEMTLANNAREMLAQTERALARIDDGSYGVCESCGQPIGKMRLMAFPRATLCLSCKQREERR
jgi:RNA polymerase-binding protein DksA